MRQSPRIMKEILLLCDKHWFQRFHITDRHNHYLFKSILLQGVQFPGQRNSRGSVEQANSWTDAQTLMGTLSEAQSLILCFSFCWLFLLSSLAVQFFYPVIFLPLPVALLQCFPGILLFLLPGCFSSLSWRFSFNMSPSLIFYVFLPLSYFISKHIYAIKDYLTCHMFFKAKSLHKEKISLRSKVTCLP